MDSKEKAIEKILEKMRTLPEWMQKGVYWLIDNIDLADEMCKGEKLSQAQIEEYIQTAKERRDCVLWILTLYKQQTDKEK
ncbi:hypothetical protein RWV98_01165 [Agathobaculum sp. NTUH-O15-33]|uniref:hypothetical protein n=1 Tax=Butyricicoccaceae TaxID=3085642 RepID=UPI00247B0D9E|nr:MULTISPECIES: hypothetical protein [Butyricicoccaceae]WNX84910.1 hypothetical protein RWV98_01165 [Agathobaculum sp. NTUH-O15-33]